MFTRDFPYIKSHKILLGLGFLSLSEILSEKLSEDPWSLLKSSLKTFYSTFGSFSKDFP